MSLLTVKYALSRTIPGKSIARSKVISDTELKISSRIAGVELDKQKVNKFRQENRGNVLKLQRAIKRIDERELVSVEKKTIVNIRKYEKNLKTQVKDIIQVIGLLKKLIENEYLEIVYDIRIPLETFEHLVTTLRKIIKNISFKKAAGKNIHELIIGIEEEYNRLINHTLKVIDEDFAHFSSIGLDFNKFDMKLKTESDHDAHLRQRSELKKQINGKTRWVISQINKLEKEIIQLAKDKQLLPQISNKLLEDLKYLKEQFSGMVDFCFKRIDVANYMIIESIIMQKEHYQELERLNTELHDFYRDFIAEQERIKQEASEYKKKYVFKRIDEFSKNQKEMRKHFEELEKSFEKKILKVKKKVIKKKQIEAKEAKSTAGEVEVQRRFFLRKAGIVTAGVGFAALNMGLLVGNVSSSVADMSKKGANEAFALNKFIIEAKVEEEGCAEWVINSYAKSYRLDRTWSANIGVSGNAWTMFNNLTKKMPAKYLDKSGEDISPVEEFLFRSIYSTRSAGSEVIFNAFEEVHKKDGVVVQFLKNKIVPEFKDLKSRYSKDAAFQMMNNSYKTQIRSLFPKRVSLPNLSNIHVGDIVGLYYSKSPSQAKAFIQCVAGTFNTHVGWVTHVDEIKGERIPVVSHNIHKKLHSDRINILTTPRNRSNSMIMWIVRPSFLKDFLQNNLTPEEEADYRTSHIKIVYGSALFTEAIIFINALNKTKKTFMEKFGLTQAEIREIIRAAFGILGRESSFGRGKLFYFEKVADLAAQAFKINFDISRGPTQVNISYFKKEMANFGITAKNIYNPKYAALATFIILAKNYMEAKAEKKWKPIKKSAKGNKWKPDDHIKRMILSYNQGFKAFERLNPYNLKVSTRRGVFRGKDYVSEVVDWGSKLKFEW